MKNIIYYLVISGFIVTGMFTSCKHEDAGPVSIADSGKFYLHLHTNIDTNEVQAYGNIYTTSGGRKVSLTEAQLYISGVELISTTGAVYLTPTKVILKTLENEEYYVAKVPAGNYKSVRLYIGLSHAINVLPSTSDTSLNHPEMWFGTTAQPDGYVYVNLQGKTDTTANATGTVAQMQPFIYKLGTDAKYNIITMPDHSPVYSVTKDNSTFAHITIDYNKLFNGVSLNNSTNLSILTPADNTSVISNSVNANIPSMFSYEE